MKTWHCVVCECELDARERVGRRDTCPGCATDLHSCRQCSLHDPVVYNECREPQAERVLDKSRANFCDYFIPGANAPTALSTPDAGRGTGGDTARAARAEFDALFRKG